MIKLMTKTWKWWDPCMTCDKNYAKNHGTMMKIVEKDDETWWTTHSKTMTKWWHIMSKMMKCDKKSRNNVNMKKIWEAWWTMIKLCQWHWHDAESWWEKCGRSQNHVENNDEMMRLDEKMMKYENNNKNIAIWWKMIRKW